MATKVMGTRGGREATHAQNSQTFTYFYIFEPRVEYLPPCLFFQDAFIFCTVHQVFVFTSITTKNLNYLLHSLLPDVVIFLVGGAGRGMTAMTLVGRDLVIWIRPKPFFFF